MCKNLDGENLVKFFFIINFTKLSGHQSFPPYGSLNNGHLFIMMNIRMLFIVMPVSQDLK